MTPSQRLREIAAALQGMDDGTTDAPHLIACADAYDERDALAEQVRGLREAFRQTLENCDITTFAPGYYEQMNSLIDAPPTAAEAKAREKAEKAALLDSATRFKVGKRKGYDVTVETREGHDGPKWAVFDGCFVLNTDGQWEHEPLPSSRTEQFLGRTRFDSLTDALRAAREASDGN